MSGKGKGRGKDKRAHPIKGTVIGTDADSVLIDAKARGRHEGGQLDVLVNSNTHIHLNDEFVELADLTPGLKVNAVCRLVGGAYVAKNINASSPEAEEEE